MEAWIGSQEQRGRRGGEAEVPAGNGACVNSPVPTSSSWTTRPCASSPRPRPRTSTSDLYELITERAGRSLTLTPNGAPQDRYPPAVGRTSDPEQPPGTPGRRPGSHQHMPTPGELLAHRTGESTDGRQSRCSASRYPGDLQLRGRTEHLQQAQNAHPCRSLKTFPRAGQRSTGSSHIAVLVPTRTLAARTEIPVKSGPGQSAPALMRRGRAASAARRCCTGTVADRAATRGRRRR